MAKLYFRHGCMDSSKTANLLMVAHNYNKKNKEVLLLKPVEDTRSSKGRIESRVGIASNCVDIGVGVDIEMLYLQRTVLDGKEYSCILVDEAQFLTRIQVQQLSKIVDMHNIPVICYGLKNSYIDGELFEGSSALLYYADSFEEIKNICDCPNCGKKATMNLRVYYGKPKYDGEIVNCGDTLPSDDYYIPVCRKHYYNPELV